MIKELALGSLTYVAVDFDLEAFKLMLCCEQPWEIPVQLSALPPYRLTVTVADRVRPSEGQMPGPG